MAAIDPSAEPEFAGSAINSTTPRATLKLIRRPLGSEDDSEDDDEDDENMRALLNGDMDDEDDESSSDEEANGGPSDPSKSKKARKEAAVKALKDAIEDSGKNTELANGVNGAGKKGKGKAIALDDADEKMSDDEDLEDGDEELVICTLDSSQVRPCSLRSNALANSFKRYQQPLDITVGEDEEVLFKVSGTHSIYLTGNYVLPVDDRPHRMYDEEDDDDEEEYPYDLTPDEDELDDESESDELDDMDDPRITELPDDEEAPSLVKASSKDNSKGKNKRPATGSDEESATLDGIMEKSLKAEPLPNGDAKLTKKQLKKLKNNAGQPITTATAIEIKTAKKEESPGGKKVQFAKNLEQGPTGKSEPPKANKSENKNDKNDKKDAVKKEPEAPKQSLGIKTIQGVKIDDKKLGSGPAAKKGHRVSMRYIGKLADGKVFDGMKSLHRTLNHSLI